MILSSAIGAAIACAAVVLVTPLVKRLAVRVGLVAHPKADRWNTHTVPLLGGVSLLAGVAAACLWAAWADNAFTTALLVGSGMLVLGLVDDVVKLKPSTKLIGQIVVACLIALIGVTPAWTPWGAANALLGILWIVGITNAINLLDNMDGLCAGVAAIASFGCWMDLLSLSPAAASYAGALFGASVGFLLYNFRPASIFMGDAGSMFLGGSLAMLSLSGGGRSGSGLVSALAVPVFLLLIPIFDTAFVTVSRLLSTRSASQGGRDHTSHRLVAMGFSEPQAVLILWLLAAAGASIAVFSRSIGSFGTVLVGPLLFLALTLLGIQLARVTVYDGDDFSLLVGKPYTPLLVDVTYRRRLFEILLDVLLVTLAYCSAYVIRFDHDVQLYYGLIQQSLPIIIGCQISALFLLGVYRGTWRHASLSDLTTYAKAIAVAILSSVIALVYLYRFEGYSRGVFIIDAMLLALFVPGSRLSFRILGDAAGRRRRIGAPALIYGAGDGGALVVTELRNNPTHGLQPIAFADDDTSKRRKRMLRLPIVGGLDELEEAIVAYGIEAVVISTSKLSAERRNAIERICHASGTHLMRLRFALEDAFSVAQRAD